LWTISLMLMPGFGVRWNRTGLPRGDYYGDRQPRVKSFGGSLKLAIGTAFATNMVCG